MSPFANGVGVLGSGSSGTNGVTVQKYTNGKGTLARVNLPGRFLYEDSNVDREEFVRLLLQSLRDVGYM